MFAIKLLSLKLRTIEFDLLLSVTSVKFDTIQNYDFFFFYLNQQ